MRKNQITCICSSKPGEEAAFIGGFPQDQHEPGGLISPSLNLQDFISIWCNSGNYRRLQLRFDPLHWYFISHMGLNKTPTSLDLPASCFPLHSPATAPGHKQNTLDNLNTSSPALLLPCFLWQVGGMPGNTRQL